MPDEDRNLTLAEVANRYPGCRGAKRLSEATVSRWITTGVRGVGGNLVRLEAQRVGCRWFVTDRALRQFAAALGTPARPAASAASEPDTDR